MNLSTHLHLVLKHMDSFASVWDFHRIFMPFLQKLTVTRGHSCLKLFPKWCRICAWFWIPANTNLRITSRLVPHNRPCCTILHLFCPIFIMKQYDLYIWNGVVNFNTLVIIILNFKYSMEVDNYACICDVSGEWLEVNRGVYCAVTEAQNCKLQITFRLEKQRNKNVLVYL